MCINSKAATASGSRIMLLRKYTLQKQKNICLQESF